jgi:hypothetical protein
MAGMGPNDAVELLESARVRKVLVRSSTQKVKGTYS